MHVPHQVHAITSRFPYATQANKSSRANPDPPHHHRQTCLLPSTSVVHFLNPSSPLTPPLPPPHTHTSPSPQVQPQQPPQGSLPTHTTSGDLAFHSQLDPHSLAINLRYRLIICLACQTSLIPSNLQSHFKHANHRSLTSPQALQLIDICKQFEVSTTYPALHGSLAPIHPVHGITVFAKAACPDCPFTAQMQQVRSHLADQHPGTPASHIIRDQPCQLLHKGSASTNFRVLPAPSQHKPQDALTALLQQLTDYHVPHGRDTTVPTDGRLVNPWLKQTGFHTYTEGKPVEELRAAVARPAPHEPALAKITTLTLDLILQANGLIQNTNDQILRKLNSDSAQE